ncbi:MAG: SLC13/DASS family transporter [Proteobacteria bacterium]|nr:SLC13/DASS family transporter [Pseudomonadota bacterium]NIS69259.1 SLC13/DASS family transporter [Pseudomonadota bacterium]
MAIWLVTLILVVAMLLLITERLPVDLTSIGILVVLILTEILTPREAIAGFATPAVITVGAMFLISKGMLRTGAVGFISQKVFGLSRGRPNLAMSMILTIVGLASAFINNTPVVVLFIPIVLSLSCELNFSPSKFLIPVSYASILAGTCTLIGSSTNIIVSDLSAQYGFGSLTMFELSRLGVPIAFFGIVFLIFAAPKLMPSTRNPVCELKDDANRRYLAELQVPRGSSIIGEEPDLYFSQKYSNMEVLELIRYSHVFYPNRDLVKIAPDDLLLVKGSASDLVEILNQDIVELTLAEQGMNFGTEQKESLIVELIIPPESSLLGERLAESRLRLDPDIHIIAIKRRELHYTEQKIKDIRLEIGDVLLVRCPESSLDRLRGETDFIIVEDVHHQIVHKHLAGRAFLIFGGLVVAASTGLVDIMVCALAAAFLMILSGCLQLRDAYRAVEGQVLLIIIGTIALSAALEKTGASELYAKAFLSLFTGASPVLVLSGVIFLTSISTHLLSNNATAILLLPIAISAAQGLGVDPKPFIIAVCFGASACFATPIGYQTNLLVYGPGGYRFSDYLKVGMPLNLLVLLMGSVFIPVIWPF